MNRNHSRREFLCVGAAAAAAWPMGARSLAPMEETPQKEEARAVRIGVVGVGGRGHGLLRTLLSLAGVEVPAVCDVREDRARRAAATVKESGRSEPEGYSRGPEDYRRLMARDDLDAVLIATPWDWHARMAVDGMKAGKYVGVEVPAAITLDECWRLVDTCEETGIPCMMLENWSFRRDNLAVLNMIRRGLLGEIVHCHCAHSHDCIAEWYFDSDGNPRWGGEFLVRRNADQYPTHSLGPVLSWMDINCGDAFAYLTSTATRSLGINDHFRRKRGPDHPSAQRTYAQGDIVTTVVKTHRGNTIVINNDMQLPRPYDNRWMIQGTLGLYDEARASVYIDDVSPKRHEWEPFAPYQEKHDHRWWREMSEEQRAKGHGGTDYLELHLFVQAVRERSPLPIDIYDSVVMSVITPLSEMSIQRGSAPVECPDFTRGRWKTRKPGFALEG
ncbi:MAG: Gfo/Idh/MocA family oxidoreductase [Planctomycetes bacterium]|nr:Gfo/Idh/MocA family oxidoreductase [Planctomycetota bacterium]